MLEGLSDTTKSHFGPLVSCVKAQVAAGKDQSQALDICSVGDRDPDSFNLWTKLKRRKGSKDRTKREADRTYVPGTPERTLSFVFARLHGNGIQLQWVKSFLPGVSVEASSKFRHGGTFEFTGRGHLRRHNESRSTFIVQLSTMHAIRYGKNDYSAQGPKPRHLVVSHPDVKKLLGQRPDGSLSGICGPLDGASCETDISKLPPVYKISGGKGEPALMVSPAALYEIVDLIPKDSTPSAEYKKESSGVSLALEPLVRSISYTTTQDVLQDSMTRLRRTCSDPDFQASQPKRTATRGSTPSSSSKKR